MSKFRVPFSWVSRLLLNKTLHLKPSTNRGYHFYGYHPISTFSSSPFQFRHNQLFQARHFCVTPEETQQAVFRLLAGLEREAKRKAGIVVDEDEEEEDYMGVGPLIEKMEKKIARDEEKYGAFYFMDTDEESESGCEDDDDEEDRAEEMRIKEEQLVERKLRRHEELIRGSIDTDNLDDAFKWMAKLDKFEDKHFNPRPEYRVIGELINRFKEATGKDKFLLAQKLNRAMRLVQQREAFDPNNPANYSIIQREEVGPSVELMDDADAEIEKDTEGVEKDQEVEEEFDDMKERDVILLQKLRAIDKKLEEELAALDHTFGKKGKLLEEEIRDLAEERNSLTEKKRVSMYRKGGQLVRNTGILPCGNYNGALDFTKFKGPAVPIPLPKAYETCFQNRMIHNLVEREKQSDGLKWESYSSVSGTAEQKTSTNQESGAQAHVLRPLSPHLPIYKPHINSTLSILNRISGSFLTLIVTSFYLIYLKLGPVCLSFENFYQFLFYSSKLTLISLEMTALALAYHVYAGVRHLLMDFSGNLIGKAGKEH